MKEHNVYTIIMIIAFFGAGIGYAVGAYFGASLLCIAGLAWGYLAIGAWLK